MQRGLDIDALTSVQNSLLRAERSLEFRELDCGAKCVGVSVDHELAGLGVIKVDRLGRYHRLDCVAAEIGERGQLSGVSSERPATAGPQEMKRPRERKWTASDRQPKRGTGRRQIFGQISD